MCLLLPTTSSTDYNDILTADEKAIVECLTELAPPRAELTAITIGKLLRYRVDRLVDGLRLIRKEERKHVMWRVEAVQTV